MDGVVSESTVGEDTVAAPGGSPARARLSLLNT
jgi:hypothetical protein